MGNAENKEGSQATIENQDPENLDGQPGAEGEAGAKDEGQGGPPAEGESQGEEEVVEIIREGETQPQQDGVPAGFLKRINKLNGKNAEVSEERDFLAEENKILKLSLEQAKSAQQAPASTPAEAPDPDQFDAGVHDADYLTALRTYNQAVLQEGIKAGVAEATKVTSTSRSQQALASDLNTKQMAHIKRCQALGVKDYEETEDKAIEALGQVQVNELIRRLPKGTELILYYFGKHPAEAQKYSAMLKEPDTAVQALVEIGGILKEIKVKKTPKSALPGPDGTPPAGTGTKRGTRGPKGATFT